MSLGWGDENIHPCGDKPVKVSTPLRSKLTRPTGVN